MNNHPPIGTIQVYDIHNNFHEYLFYLQLGMLKVLYFQLNTNMNECSDTKILKINLPKHSKENSYYTHEINNRIFSIFI